MDTKDTEQSAPEQVASGDQQKVLIAEDNEVVRKGLINFMNKWGYVAIEAEDGEKARQLLEEDEEIRLAILDWNLPGISSMEVCETIRSYERYIYVLIFSARKSAQEQLTALNGGADDYLIKPSKPSFLRARLGVGKRIIEAMPQATLPAKTKTSTLP